MIGVIGVNHKTASLDIRDLFSIAQDDIIPLSENILLNQDIVGVVIVATCNRTEIYYSHQKSDVSQLKEALLKKVHLFLGLDKSYDEHFYHLSQSDAIRHLFKVISGVDSMVLGENQIVNQMKKSYLYSTEANLTDAVLMRLFQKSFECSKRVRTETEIQQGATSIGYLGIDLCSREFENIKEKSVLVIGAGETGELSIRGLIKRGVDDIYVTNRTDKKALEVAEKNNIKPMLFGNYKEQLHKVDIVITATDAGKYLIEKKDVEIASDLRNGKKQLYIDLSVPRNVDLEVAEVKGVQLYSVDDLKNILDAHQDMRENSLGKAEVIIDELVDDSLMWLNSRSLRPVINTITTNMQELNKRELAEFRRCLGDEACDQLEKMTGLLTQKYIRYLIKNLKEVTNNGSSTQSLDDINQLFKFDI
ncbi:glutamyl-tRNA reductase [Saccharicrinis fermentans]|uniref:Glutamyl-tRNA reductase n=1 Tax=Saccharicrinis fermentans DSM 9555 = JCM 21142 TaxID=869213 RepID=W7YHH7_9BACT|nr:glutamyl-tRNA reductase [Saccharicrinis fermentans]GAF03906.1 glutamyl-tRNA reductase [Saccharicrinis fermentans DSM 9555 = JCM 21142]